METSSEKTKRNIINELSKDEYRYRSVIFFNEYLPEIFDHAHKIRKAISKRVNNKIFWLVRTKYIPTTYIANIPEGYSKKNITQPYLQFFTKNRIDEEIIEQALSNIELDFNF